jgi:proteasome lid subunit RPN8/RPN11
MLEYVGEWHTHPGSNVEPSHDDQTAFAWLCQAMEQEGLPPVMLIAGESHFGWYVARMPS